MRLEVGYHLKVIVYLRVPLNVLLNHIIRYITCTTCKISSGPHPLSPILFSKYFKLTLHFIG
ncbi:hypothetical protein CCP4SC76_7230011 [Gammaproteobacteria bacterium]